MSSHIVNPLQNMSESDAKVVIPSLDEDVTMDLEQDEEEVLRRYETIFRSLVAKKILQPLTRRYNENDIGRNIQGTIIDWSVCHGLQGDKYIEEIQMNMQYTVLQSALILTISMPLYIDPPSFDDDNNAHGFSAIVGIAAFCQLGVIIACTIAAAALNRPFSGGDTMVARVQAQSLIVVINVANYISNLATVAAMFIAGFARSTLDGGIQLFACVMIIGLFALFISSDKSGKIAQDQRVLSFYDKYCEDNGRLKREYLLRVYGEAKKKDD